MRAKDGRYGRQMTIHRRRSGHPSPLLLPSASSASRSIADSGLPLKPLRCKTQLVFAIGQRAEMPVRLGANLDRGVPCNGRTFAESAYRQSSAFETVRVLLRFAPVVVPVLFLTRRPWCQNHTTRHRLASSENRFLSSRGSGPRSHRIT